MGLEEALILLYLLVDDGYRAVTFGGRLRQRGPGPKRSDVEVLTMEIFGEQQGRHDDASIHRYFDGHWRHFFPKLGSYQAFARQCAALSVIKQRILEHLFPANGDIHLLDGFPIPIRRTCRGTRCRTFRDVAAWGYCATKQEYFYGLRGHLVITLAVTAVAFTVTAANIDERDVVPNLQILREVQKRLEVLEDQAAEIPVPTEAAPLTSSETNQSLVTGGEGTRRRLTPAGIAEVERLIRVGAGDAEIAGLVGMDRGAIRQRRLKLTV